MCLKRGVSFFITAAEALRSHGLVVAWCVFLFCVLAFQHFSILEFQHFSILGILGILDILAFQQFSIKRPKKPFGTIVFYKLANCHHRLHHLHPLKHLYKKRSLQAKSRLKRKQNKFSTTNCWKVTILHGFGYSFEICCPSKMENKLNYSLKNS